jgi:hypothetical protein
MNRCKTHLLRVCLCLLAAIPAYCQRADVSINVGETHDRFGAQPSATGLVFQGDGQVAVIQGKKDGGPGIVVGGEIIIPADTANHAKEYAVFGGPMFRVHDFTIGFNAQVRKLILPVTTVDTETFTRKKMELLELPLYINYKFGPSKRAFVQVQGAPEFTPRWRSNGAASNILPNPKFDHGYFVRGSVGYQVRSWYLKGTYETRYFKFLPTSGNPNGLYNWRTNVVTGGIGVIF